ncbi:MAG: hypothetical protein OSA92_05065 [Pirellulaceae bacterium]|nr:hypothetical protein [Pirellulaceae bacterium]
MVFGRKKKQDAIMDAVLRASGETDLTADPSAPAKVTKKQSAAKTKSKSKPISDNLLIVHAEKIALTVAILLSGYLIYAGMGAGVDDQGNSFKKESTDLDKLITEANTSITEGKWNNEKDNYLVTSYESRAKNSQMKINADDYSPTQLFNPPINRIITRREDPQLYPVMDIRTFALTGPVAYILGDKEVDPTASDEPAQEVIEEKKPIRKSPKKDDESAFGGAGMGDMPGMGEEMGEEMGGEMGGMGGMGAVKGAIRKLRSDRGQILGYRPTGGDSGEMGGMGGEMGGMGGEMGGMGGMMGGMEGTEGGDDGGSSQLTGSQPMGTPVARSRTIVAGTALVPFKQQFDEFERALAMRSGYDGYRDQPDYVFMYVERVDVTSDPAQVVDESQWQRILHTNAHRTEQRKWHSTAAEIVAPSYLNPYISLQCPPVMVRNLDNLLRHPEIPLAGVTVQKPEEQEAGEETQEEPEDNNGNEDLPGGLANNPNENTNTNPGAPGGMGGMEDMTGMGEMMGGMGGMGGMMGGMGGELQSANIPDYKLVRFYDFSAEIGHVYRYRVQLLIEDPNHPNTIPDDEYRDHPVPKQVTLKDDVIQRIKQLDSLIFYRSTPWSEPSEPVAVLDPLQFAGGTADVVKTLTDPVSRRSFQDHEPSGVVKTIMWDENRAVDIMFDRPVHRGSFMNFSADAEYGHPITEIIMAAGQQQFKTDFIIGDIRGGDTLPLDTKDMPYHAPGEFLLIDAQGNLVVRTELTDETLFRRYNYASDTGDQFAPSDTGMGGMGGMMGGMGGALPGGEGN